MKNIVFDDSKKIFTLTTKNTLYAFKVICGKYLVQLFYGKRGEIVKDYSPYALAFASYAEEKDEKVYFDTTKAEYPFFGSGDFCSDALRIRNVKGNNATLFLYDGYETFSGRKEIIGLPFAEADKDTETLCITLKDTLNGLVLKLYYTVFYDTDIISRYIEIENLSDNGVFVENAKSLSVDLEGADNDIITLVGAHYYERRINRVKLTTGKHVYESHRGTSSHQYNPFLAVCEATADYENGNVYGFNYIYSGSFENVVEKNTIGKIRVQIGMNGAAEGFMLESGRTYRSPEAVMTFSDEGIGKMSRNFHKFIKKHIIIAEKQTIHPLVLNTWEAFYFDIDEKKLLDLAVEAKKLGIDTLVVDDGWFSTRNAENAGLGDWWVNTDKFPDGLKGFSEKIAARRIKLGIWIEPEMVNPDSELYREHKEWCLNAYGRSLSLSRNQLVLNLGLTEVREYLKNTFKKVFSGVTFSYIKWDMNRSLSMVGCNYDGGRLCDNDLYRKYVDGVYDLHQWFTSEFNNIIIEGCSGGGGRYDLGIMRYVSQIWTSDNTFPQDRAWIQFGSLLAYPACVMSCHVSNYHNVMENDEEADFRYKIAAQGVLGYEMDVLSVSEKIKERIKAQINDYGKIKDTVINGDFYPIIGANGLYVFYYHNEKTGEILLFYANSGEKQKLTVKIKRADMSAVYKERISGKEFIGRELLDGFTVEANKKADYIHFIKK